MRKMNLPVSSFIDGLPVSIYKPPKIKGVADCISSEEDVMVVLFCKELPQLVVGNFPFQKGNE